MRDIYDPSIFDAANIAAAKNIILTPDGASTETRWSIETPYLLELVHAATTLSERSIVLDYGCGIGRLTRELVHRHKCRAIGVDISANMRALAADYVRSDRFLACAPTLLDTLVEQGVRADVALAVWVLQHCCEPADDIARIVRALKPGGLVVVVNQRQRVVPIIGGTWANDDVDVRALLAAALECVGEGALDPTRVGPVVAGAATWSVFRRPDGTPGAG